MFRHRYEPYRPEEEDEGDGFGCYAHDVFRYEFFLFQSIRSVLPR